MNQNEIDQFISKMKSDEFCGLLQTRKTISELKETIRVHFENSQWNWIAHYSEQLEQETRNEKVQGMMLIQAIQILQQMRDTTDGEQILGEMRDITN